MTRQPFENLKYRIHNIPKSSDLMLDFPDLKKHEEALTTYTTQGEIETETGKKWGEIQNRITKDQLNKLIRYMVYLYDPKSDLIRQESDLSERKKRASELAEFKEYNELWVLDKSFYFLTRVYNDRKFREWCVLQQELEEKDKTRWTPINEDETKDPKQFMEAHEKKGKLREQSHQIHKALDVIETEIFGENEDMKAKANELLLTTPEKIAEAYR